MAHEFSPARSTRAKRRFRGSTLWGAPTLTALPGSVALALSGVAACLAGCAAEQTPPLASTPTQRPPEPQVAPPQVAQPAPPPVVEFRLGKKIEIRPASTTLELPKLLSAREVTQRALPVQPKPGLWAMLDQHPARSFASRKLKFIDLLNEDEELAPGFHWLSLFQETGTEEQPILEFSLSAVAVESEPEGMPLAPGCALLWPVGTYNGLDAAANIRVLAVPRQAGVTTIRYEARAGEWVSQGQFEVGQVLLLDSPPDGDVEVSATCMVEQESLSMTTQIITINSDTPPLEVAR